MEKVGVAPGAATEDVDAMFCDARVSQLPTVDGGEIAAPGLFQAKLTRYFRANFVAASTNARPDGSTNVHSFGAVEPVHFLQRTYHDSRRRAAPSRMYCRDRVIAAVGQQYGVAVRGSNRYGNSSACGH